VGFPVVGVRYGATLFGGAMAGIAGGYYSIVYLHIWQEQLTSGRGWIALALVVFATWRPGRLMIGALLFGAVMALQFYAQAVGVPVPTQFLAMLPYLATIVVLVLISRNPNSRLASERESRSPSVSLNVPRTVGISCARSGSPPTPRANRRRSPRRRAGAGGWCHWVGRMTTHSATRSRANAIGTSPHSLDGDRVASWPPSDTRGPPDHPVDEQQHDSAQRRHQKSSRFARSIQTEGPAQETTNHGADNAEHRGDDEAARIPARHQQLGDDPDDESKQNPTEYAQHAKPSFDLVSRSATVRPPKATELITRRQHQMRFEDQLPDHLGLLLGSIGSIHHAR